MDWRVTSEGVVQSTRIVPVEEVMLGEYLDRVFRKNSEEIAIVDTKTKKQYTYGDLLRMSKSIGAVLQGQGVKPHDLVVLCAVTGIEACCYFLAIVFCQATMLAPKPSSSVHEFEDLMRRFPALKLVVGDSATVPKLRQATSVEVLNIEENWDLGRAAEFEQPSKADPKTSVMIMALTSGSTGPSKAVCISNYNLMGDLTQLRSEFSRHLMCNPICNLSADLVFLMTLGNAETMFLASENLKDNLDEYLSLCSEHKIETSLTLPMMFTSLTKLGSTDKLATIKRFITGGSTIPQPIIDQFRKLHPHIHVEVVFGTSESGVNLHSVEQNKVNHLAPLRNVEVKILDLETNEVLGPNQNGMLYSKAPSISLGYYNDEKATREAFVDGWHVTGDIAYRDDEGLVVIVDRLKQMIKCMDKQVAPADLENLLSQDEDVLKVLVAGVPHDDFGQAPVAFVIPRDKSRLGELRKRLLEDVESKCAFYKHLHGGLYFVEKIPETDSGKPSRKVIIHNHVNKLLEYLD